MQGVGSGKGGCDAGSAGVRLCLRLFGGDLTRVKCECSVAFCLYGPLLLEEWEGLFFFFLG